MILQLTHYTFGNSQINEDFRFFDMLILNKKDERQKLTNNILLAGYNG